MMSREQSETSTARGHKIVQELRHRLNRSYASTSWPSKSKNGSKVEASQAENEVDAGVQRTALAAHPPDLRAWKAMARLYAGIA